MLKSIKLKKVLALLIALLTLSLVGFMAAEYNTFASTSTPDVARFYMSDGASIKTAGDGYGIRFQTTVTSTYYENLLDTYGENADVKFYTLINHSGADVEDIVYTDTTNNWLVSCSKTARFTDNEFVFYSTLMYPDTNEYSAEVLDKAFGLDVTARSYVTVDGVFVDYAEALDTSRSMKGVANQSLIMDDTNDEAFTPTEEQKLKSYLIKETATIHETTKESAGFYGDTTVEGETVQTGALKLDKDCDVSTLEVGKSLYAYVGAKSVELKKIDEKGTMEINGLKVDSSSIGKNGETYTLSVIAPNGDLYRQNFTAVTRRITTAEDLAIFTMGYEVDDSKDYSNNTICSGDSTKKYSGYYVLANDIDATNYNHKTPYLFTANTNTLESPTTYFQQNGVRTCGLTGTFDGNGYTISNLTFGKDYAIKGDSTKYALEYGCSGLFGAIGYGGTVKNVAFDNVTYGMTGSCIAKNTFVLATFIVEANIENVSIKLNGLNRKDWQIGTSSLAHQIISTKMSNVMVEVQDDGSTGTHTNSNYFGSLVARNNGNATGIQGGEYGTWTNVYVVSSVGVALYGNVCAENETGDTKLAGVKRYANGCDLYTAKNDYTAFDNGNWTLVDDCAPVWKGEKAAKYLSFAYSQDDKAFFDGKTKVDFAKFGGENATINLANYALSVESGAVSILKDSSASFVAKGEALEIFFEGETFDSVISTNVYTRVINEASDLAIFTMGYTVDPDKEYNITTICTGDSTTKYDGYYILGGDIDATDYKHKTPYLFTGNGAELAWPEWFQSGGKTCGLTGTFDGNGYTISNLTFGKDEKITWDNRFAQEYGNAGLFGAIGRDGTVKNVAFDNVSFALEIGNGVECKVANTFVLATYIVEANIENVHISLNGLNRVGTNTNANLGSTATLAHQIMNSTMTNVVIELADDGLTGAVASTNYGSLVGRNNANMSGNLANYGTWTNVIVISTIGLGRNGAMCGENETSGSTILTGARRYDNVKAFDDDTEKDLSGFEDSGFWTVGETGLPVFGK